MIQEIHKSGNKDKNLTMCIACGYVHDKKKDVIGIWQREMHKQDLPKFGYFFICDECAHKVHSYYEQNATMYGIPKKHGFQFSIELETENSTFESSFLYAYQYIPTYDGSLGGGVEWKSPIYYGLSAVPKLLATIYGKMKAEKLEIGDSCGTHFHISNMHYDNAFYRFLADNYKEVFYDMHSRIKGHGNNYMALFGRQLKHYCGNVQDWDSPSSHQNFISIRSNRIEFRQPKFVSDTQYMECLKFGRDILSSLYKEWEFSRDAKRMSNECVRILTQYTFKY